MGHVLVVDDNIHNVKLLEARLQVAAYAVETASSGPEALAKAAASPPDLVLLDVMMPGMDGYEVCRRLRGDPATARLPVVLVTALDGEGDKAAGREAGADAFLTKPAPDDQLFPTMKRLLERGA
ncbi:response regulator [Caulobacter sp. KR2-114]|uniref:response regulator n=1 Tax=Caulobacter sp. KR2-114 TaxID=3400912 RepID=UPI003C0827BE